MQNVISWFGELHHITQALLATLFTWGVTAFGASLVFFFKGFNRTLLNTMLGFGAGVMIAASFWSLLAPAIEISGQIGLTPWFQALFGFSCGVILLLLVDMFLPHMHIGKKKSEGIKTSWQRSVLLVLAITLHNIPEGLAIGVAFGAAATGINGATIGAAIALSIGIGLQNFPEGTAVAVPLRREGLSLKKSFFYGQISGAVEPISGVLGAMLVIFIRDLLPFALSFAAGAMLYVVIEQLIPESQMDKRTKYATIGTVFGFAVMMSLDVALG